MFRPKDWVVGGNPKIDGVQYHNHDDENSYEAGADAMLEALLKDPYSRTDIASVPLPDVTIENNWKSGTLVFIPAEGV